MTAAVSWTVDKFSDLVTAEAGISLVLTHKTGRMIRLGNIFKGSHLNCVQVFAFRWLAYTLFFCQDTRFSFSTLPNLQNFDYIVREQFGRREGDAG